jgi:MOSC domain-containing protein YiiM
MSNLEVHIERIVTSPDHNYVGHHGRPAGQNPGEPRQEVRLIAGRGIEGDRYARREAGHHRQITFFDMATIDDLSRHLDRPIEPGAVRRNVFVRGADLNSLVGSTFTLQGVRFEGVDPCKPCHWMNEAVAPGAEELMQGRGGLRARILSDGMLRCGPATLQVEGPR